MKKNRYTEEQIAYAPKQADVGTAVPEICRKLGIAEQTFYRWLSKYAGMLPSGLKRLKQLQTSAEAGSNRTARQLRPMNDGPWISSPARRRPSRGRASVRFSSMSPKKGEFPHQILYRQPSGRVPEHQGEMIMRLMAHISSTFGGQPQYLPIGGFT